ncbi:MAG: gfo/Idh/MocA family oxidoreductase, partial [Prosthecobacter sp.]
MNPNLTSRRAFITQSALAFTALSASRVLGANEKIRLASIGLGGQGTGNAGRMAKVPGVEVVMLCDPDTAQLEKVKKLFP